MTGADRRRLAQWYAENGRDLPWRRIRDPYAVWVSEIMLQQTQVATALPYYERWMARFPTLVSLAAAAEPDALSIWQGLGYYRRCRNLVAGAKSLVNYPTTAAGWRKVPGVGRYTAAAIASICFDEPVAVVDGNVARVFARMTVSDRASGTATWKWAQSLIDAKEPGKWNQAMMELGARVCRPRDPLCDECPVRRSCRAYRSGRTADFPRPAPRPKPVTLSHEAWIHECEGKFGLEPTPDGLWRFPQQRLVESGTVRESAVQDLGQIRHVVTNKRITLTVRRRKLLTASPDLVWYSAEEAEELPMSAPQRRALNLARRS